MDNRNMAEGDRLNQRSCRRAAEMAGHAEQTVVSECVDLNRNGAGPAELTGWSVMCRHYRLGRVTEAQKFRKLLHTNYP